MPYIRVYLPKASVDDRRFIARKLIDVTLRTFHLRADERHRISVEFVSSSPARWADYLVHEAEDREDFMVEVMAHELSEERERAFSNAAAAVLDEFLTFRWQSRIARLLGINMHAHPKIAFRFGELNPAVSEPFVVHSGPLAA